MTSTTFVCCIAMEATGISLTGASYFNDFFLVRLPVEPFTLCSFALAASCSISCNMIGRLTNRVTDKLHTSGFARIVVSSKAAPASPAWHAQCTHMISVAYMYRLAVASAQNSHLGPPRRACGGITGALLPLRITFNIAQQHTLLPASTCSAHAKRCSAWT